MPDFKGRRRRGNSQKDKSPRKDPMRRGNNKGRDAESAHSVSGDRISDEAFQRHAALLGDHRMAHPANAGQRADIVRQIQRDYGNSYVQRLVDHVSSLASGQVQAKLEVGPAGDKFEREVDEIAHEVVRNSDQPVNGVSQGGDNKIRRAPPNYANIPENVARDLEDNYNNIPQNIRNSLEDNYNNIPADVLSDWDNNYNNIPEEIRASLEDNYNNIPSGVLSDLEDNYNNIPDSIQMTLPIPYANVPAQHRQGNTQSESSTGGPKVVSVFERLVGGMGILVQSFNDGGWRHQFKNRIDPTNVFINQMLQTLGSQKTLSKQDQNVLKIVSEFAVLAIGLQAQSKGGGNVNSSLPDLRKILSLVKSSSSLLDEGGRKSLMNWLPKGVVEPPAEGKWGEAIKPASDARGGGGTASYGVPIFVDDAADNYNNMPEDPSANYNNLDDVADQAKQQAKNPYGVAIPLSPEQEEERMKMGGHRARRRS